MVEHFCVKFGDLSCCIFGILCGRHTDRHTNTAENPTPANTVGVGNNNNKRNNRNMALIRIKCQCVAHDSHDFTDRFIECN